MANYKKPAAVWAITMMVLIGLLGTGCLLNKTNKDLYPLVRNDNIEPQEYLKENSELGTTMPPPKKDTLQDESAIMDSKDQYVQSSKVENLGLLTISIPDNFIKSETKTYTYCGDDFKGANQFAGWEGTINSIQYVCPDAGLELNIFMSSLSEDTAKRYIEPLITDEYNSKIERLKIMEAQTGSFFDQGLQDIYPFNEMDTMSMKGGGRVLTSRGLPSTDNLYSGDEIQENYGFMLDGREYITRNGALGCDFVSIYAVYSDSEALALCKDIFKTVI
ncbi:MAG TPA: hypothetical protein VFD57_04180, partial [Clostridia bacterium]|nr:hypothetical protein [Clostridia bacterium]